MATEVDELLADLRAVFADVPHPAIGVCRHCYSDADEAALKGPRDAVPDDLVVSVAAEVFDHWPEPADLYRWLTPRIIELMVTDRLAVDETLIASRLDDAGFSAWPANQRGAVLNVAQWWWVNSLSREPDLKNHALITDVLGFLVRISGTEERWLATWASLPAGPADAQMQVLCRQWLPYLHAGSLEVGWTGGWDIIAPVKSWLLQTARPRLVRLGDRAAEQLRSLEELRQA